MYKQRRLTQNASTSGFRKLQGDVLLQDILLDPATIKRGLDILSNIGAGQWAYKVFMKHEFEVILQRRFDVYEGPDVFNAPHYALEDPAVAALYNVAPTKKVSKVKSQQDVVNDLLYATALECLDVLPGLIAMQQKYEDESWKRAGVQDPEGVQHPDPDVSLFGNREHRKWTAIDNPIATSQKRNQIVFYGDGIIGYNDDIYPMGLQPGFLFDRKF